MTARVKLRSRNEPMKMMKTAKKDGIQIDS